MPSLISVTKKLNKINCNCLARKTLFKQRESRKIEPQQLLQSLCASALHPRLSLNLIANQLSLTSGQSVTKQAVAKRLNDNCVDFLHHALFTVIGKMAQTDHLVTKSCFTPFNRVLIQDSTCLTLSDKLVDNFPGAKNQTGKKKAGIRLQAIYDLLHERFVHFDPAPFCRNDQAAASDILDFACPEDLILRDLGYFSLPTFAEMTSSNIYFLSRFRHDVIPIDPVTGKRLDLVALLKKQSVLDIDVQLGVKHRLPVRLIALPVPEKIANERRRKAKNNRCSSCRPSKEHLWLLGWQIMITNVGRSRWRTKQVVKAYTARWRIEIIFKAWKSHFNFSYIPAGNRAYVLCAILAKLLFITCFQVFFDKLNAYMAQKYKRPLSMLKLSAILGNHGLLFFQSLADNPDRIDHILLCHCTYEKRKRRINYPQLLDSLA